MILQKIGNVIRNGVMLVIALATCPCHWPITIPLLLVLLAGTPAAAWLTQHVAWEYSILTGIFILSVVFGVTWARQSKEKTGEVCDPQLARPINKSTTQIAIEGVKYE